MNTKVLHQFLILGMLPALASDVDRLSTTTTLTMLQKSCAETSAKLHTTDVALTRMEANQRDILAYLMRVEKNQQEFLSRFGQEESLLKRKASSIGSPTTDASVAASQSCLLMLQIKLELQQRRSKQVPTNSH
mmetsp:Transcript_12419/g.19117  ORF Transcript_12419/g.19117 Transcript_12419/m.19117 type:complete len:133 (+) Transcript_12419:154-552(+)